MRNKIIAALAAALILLGGTSAYANSSEAPNEDYSGYSALDRLATPAPTSAAQSKASRTISTSGTGHIVDNIDDTESDKLQFITVTAKDGSVFYVVIDKQNSNDNVYFLNTVDISDLNALTKEGSAQPAVTAPTPAPSVSPAPDAQEQETKQDNTEPKQEKQPVSSTTLILILALIAAAVVGGYYFKVVIPKKKLEQADDLEDFDFENSENADDDYSDETDDNSDETEE